MAETYFASITVSSRCLGVPVQDSDLISFGASRSVRQKKGESNAAPTHLSSQTLRDAFFLD